MARLRYNGLSATLGGSLTSSATSVTFGAALTHSNGTAVPTISGSDYIPLSILDASGHLSEIVYLTAYTAAATTGTITRGQEGTTGVAHSSGDKVVGAVLVADVGGVLAFTKYAPASQVLYAPTTTSYVDMDATNAKITFTTPASGNVRIDAQIGAIADGATRFNVNLREGSTNLSGSGRTVMNNGSSIQFDASPKWIITGLTPGSSHTYKLGMARTSGTGSPIFVVDPAGDWGPLLITVTALP